MVKIPLAESKLQVGENFKYYDIIMVFQRLITRTCFSNIYHVHYPRT